jgi:hypothetical protein
VDVGLESKGNEVVTAVVDGQRIFFWGGEWTLSRILPFKDKVVPYRPGQAVMFPVD